MYLAKKADVIIKKKVVANIYMEYFEVLGTVPMKPTVWLRLQLHTVASTEICTNTAGPCELSKIFDPFHNEENNNS